MRREDAPHVARKAYFRGREMFYRSTRGGIDGLTASDTITRGIAPDGGLFVPESQVRLSLDEIENMSAMNYAERAVFILKPFLGDFSEDEIRDCVNKAYTREKFDSDRVVPLRKLNENVSILELWHGPTCAFKDLALQILPHLLLKAAGKTGESREIVILVATSGDTGKAALEGFKDVDGTKVIVFYPEDGVSRVQKLQMITQEGSNVYTVGVKGNFDDAQNGAKEIFNDAALREVMDKKGYTFSSANSINWGRLVPQTVYYVSAYADMLESGEIKPGEKINIVVPTGNFGNILAAYYAAAMGLPVNRLICASNENNVLTDFINTGIYDRNRRFIKTLSPSMDILISSNLERLLFELTDHSGKKVAGWMAELSARGTYTVDKTTLKRIQKLFWAGFTNDDETLKTIECIYKEYGYLVDTHTAVAIDVYDRYVISTGDMTKTVIASTASPFKFNESVAKAVFGQESIKGLGEFQLLDKLSKGCGLEIPPGLRDLDKKEIRHKLVCERTQMKKAVMEILGIQ